MNSYPLIAGVNSMSLSLNSGYNLLFDATHLGMAANRIRVTITNGSSGQYVYVLPNAYLEGATATQHLFTPVNGRTNAQVNYSFVLTDLANLDATRTADGTNMPVRPGDYLQVTASNGTPPTTTFNYTALIVEAVRPLNATSKIVLCTATKATSITDATATFSAPSVTTSFSDPALQLVVAGTDSGASTRYFTGRLTNGVNLTTLATTPVAKRPAADGEKFNLCSIDHIKKFGICLEAARTDGGNVLDSQYYDVRSGTGIYHGLAMYATAALSVNVQVYNAF